MFISTVVCLVPVVDCSEAVGVIEMTEVIIPHLYSVCSLFSIPSCVRILRNSTKTE